ncbi:MAG TPA: hypothetical protein PL085_11490 [Agriterribacter sp.]|uniref:hypothetical protein n=1 Tax=Agriterribacter sp. TaxID=2821509 RepID=UPI002BB8BC68|nr:hypothetical protein [Agriterribacter sp.]HRQ17692.1 hypothetical protein [Agriterribacter sp.]
METIELIKSIFTGLGIDWSVVLLYICSGLLVKAYLPDNIRIPFTKINITVAWRTLVIGSIITLIYVFIEYRYPSEFNRETLKRLFVSYIFTTSFYELVLKDTVVNLIINLLSKLKPAKNESDN